MDQLTPEQLQGLFDQLVTTDVTKPSHRELYPALSPSKPEFSQAGRTVLITGGGTTVGYAIGRAFVQASAKTVIIIGRRAEVLESAKTRLESEAKAAGTKTNIIAQTCDVTNMPEVEKFWKGLAADGITVDVFVANAAKFTEPAPILELGADEVWSQVETNAKAPLYFAEKFNKQLGDKQGVGRSLSLCCFHYMLTQSRSVPCQCLKPDHCRLCEPWRRHAPCVRPVQDDRHSRVPAHRPKHSARETTDCQLPSGRPLF